MIDYVSLEKKEYQGVSYLLNAITNNGSFIYEIHSKNGVISNKYNLLRHAGSLYSIYNSTSFLEIGDNFQRAEKAFDFLKLQIFPLKVNRKLLSCVVESDEIKLGGVSLTLIALLERYKCKTETKKEDMELMQSLGSFIVWMQEPSGKFKFKMSFKDKKVLNFESTYYSGQSILALLRLYSIDKNVKWLNSAEKASHYLLRNPVMNIKFVRGHNHWFVIALSELCLIRPNEDYYLELSLIVDSTIESIEKNLRHLSNKKTEHLLYSSAAMATRCEAVLAAITLDIELQNFTQLESRIGTLMKALEYCLSLQLNSNNSSIPFNLKGGIKKNGKNSLIRIDYVQHVLSVITGLLKIHPILKSIYTLI